MISQRVMPWLWLHQFSLHSKTGKGGKKQTPKTVSQEHCETKLCMRARAGKAVQIKNKVERPVWSMWLGKVAVKMQREKGREAQMGTGIAGFSD